MTCPACGVGMIEEDVQALIDATLTDSDAHDHDIVLDGDDVYTITQNYADARPATQFIVPGLTAANVIASEWAPQPFFESVSDTTPLPADGVAYLVTTKVIPLPTGWGSMRVKGMVEFVMTAGASSNYLVNTSVRFDAVEIRGTSEPIQNWYGGSWIVFSRNIFDTDVAAITYSADATLTGYVLVHPAGATNPMVMAGTNIQVDRHRVT